MERETAIKAIEKEIESLSNYDFEFNDGRDELDFSTYKRFCESVSFIDITLQNIQKTGKNALTEEEYKKVLEKTPLPINYNQLEDIYNYTIDLGENLIRFLKNL